MADFEFQKGKLVNGAFGSNVPELMDLISRELDIERRTREHGAEKCGRIYYELNEMTPVELKRFNAKRSRDEECERIEREAAQHRRHEYLTFVTDQIMAKASDLGASIFMPHVISRDLMKRLTEPADKCQLAAKDKKTIRLAPEHVEVIEMDGQKPMPQYLLDEIGSNDVFMVCWKLTESNGDSCKTVEGSYDIREQSDDSNEISELQMHWPISVRSFGIQSRSMNRLRPKYRRCFDRKLSRLMPNRHLTLHRKKMETMTHLTLMMNMNVYTMHLRVELKFKFHRFGCHRTSEQMLD